MDMNTLQEALKALYGSFGGNLDAVRDIEDISAIIRTMAGLGIGEKLAGAVEFPEVPESDGTYVLTCTVADGAATFSFESAE